MTEKEKPTRRDFLKYATGAAGLVVGGVAGYYLGMQSAPPGVQQTVTQAVTETLTQTVGGPATTVVAGCPSGPNGVTCRALTAMKDMIASGKIPAGYQYHVMAEAGFMENAFNEAIRKLYEVSGITKDQVSFNVVASPFTENYGKILAEATDKSGSYDSFGNCLGPWLPDFAVAGLAAQLDDYYAKYNPNVQDDIYYPLNVYVSTFNNHKYAIPDDGDVLINYYRKDLVADTGERDAFKSKYGYDLKPPDTFQEYTDVSAFFTRKAGDKLAGQTLARPFYGTTEWRAKGFAKTYLIPRCCNFNEDPTKVYFDEDTMNPLMNSDTNVAALEHYVACQKFMSPDILGYAFGENYAQFLGGDCFQFWSWGVAGKGAEDPVGSKIVGKVGYALTPGYKLASGKIIRRTYLAHGNTHMISNYSKNPEFAYLFAQAINGNAIAPWMIANISESNIDPYRASDEAEEVRLWSGLDTEPSPPRVPSAVWPEAADWIKMQRQSLQMGFPELMIPGYGDYMLDQLENAVVQAAQGVKTPKGALDDCAKAWDKITDKLGRDKQKGYYKSLMDLVRQVEAKLGA